MVWIGNFLDVSVGIGKVGSCLQTWQSYLESPEHGTHIVQVVLTAGGQLIHLAIIGYRWFYKNSQVEHTHPPTNIENRGGGGLK